MRIENLFHGRDTRGLNKIGPELIGPENGEMVPEKKSYDVFRVLLENNRKIKARENRPAMAEIVEGAGISRATLYRTGEKIEKGKMPPLQIRSLFPEKLEKY
ncbi:MAG: hypothetical protein LBU15_02930 [Rickettsiales bacterium]|nr:hypothetical protein [Rickettsiales bacterium]